MCCGSRIQNGCGDQPLCIIKNILTRVGGLCMVSIFAHHLDVLNEYDAVWSFWCDQSELRRPTVLVRGD